MSQKVFEKQKAILLRQQGLSYREILAQVPVAKSTLSMWLRQVGLSVPQRQRLTEKRIASARKASAAWKQQRIVKMGNIIHKASEEIGNLSNRELWLIGIALYWAEGSKEKEHSPGSPIQFTNTDTQMLQVFMRWLEVACTISKKEMIPSIYIHQTKQTCREEIITYWAQKLGFRPSDFKVYYKKNVSSRIYNIDQQAYYGTVRITVSCSSTLNRKIAGWIQGIRNNCGIV